MNPENISASGQQTAWILYYLLVTVIALLFVLGRLFRKRLNDRTLVWLTCTAVTLIPLALLAAAYTQRNDDLMKYVFASPVFAIFLLGGLFRKSIGDRGRAWLTCVTMALIPLALLSTVYVREGKDLMKKGVRAPLLGLQIQKLERYLSSHEHLIQRDKPYSIVVIGDSTHFLKLAPDEQMMPQIGLAFPEHLKNKVELYGLRFGALDAFDYYFLLNRLVEEKPDMILLPVNLRSFSVGWAQSDMTYFPSLERLTRWQEIPRASYLSSDSREIRWDLIAMRKLDHAIVDGRVGAFLRGIKLDFAERKSESEHDFEEQLAQWGSYIPDTWAQEVEYDIESYMRKYAKYIDRDHSMLNAFGALNSLAHRHGIRVAYYAVQLDLTTVRQEENFEMIEEVLLQDPNVEFINILGLLEPHHFLLTEHLTPEGIQLVAGRLADEVEKIVLRDISTP